MLKSKISELYGNTILVEKYCSPKRLNLLTFPLIVDDGSLSLTSTPSQIDRVLSYVCQSHKHLVVNCWVNSCKVLRKVAGKQKCLSVLRAYTWLCSQESFLERVRGLCVVPVTNLGPAAAKQAPDLLYDMPWPNECFIILHFFQTKQIELVAEGWLLSFEKWQELSILTKTMICTLQMKLNCHTTDNIEYLNLHSFGCILTSISVVPLGH